MPAHQILQRIDQIFDNLSLTPAQRRMAQSLAIAGAVSSLLQCSPRELLEALRPALERLDDVDADAIRDAVEGRR